MTKKLHPIHLLFIAIIMAFVSCHTLVSDEFPDFKPVPVVNAILVAGEPVAVHVSMAGKLDTFELEPVLNAEILLFINNSLMDTLHYSDSGYYTSTILVEEGKTYRCETTIPGYETISATDSLPFAIHICNIEHINYAGKDEEGSTYPAVKITFPTKPSSLQYFEIRIYLDYYHLDKDAQIETITDPVILNEGLPIWLFSNETIRDSIYTLMLNYTSGSHTRVNGGPLITKLFPLVVELRTVSYNYYRYTKQLFLYEQGRYSTGLESPVTAFPLYSNITNGYGIFAGYSASVSDTIIPTPYDR